MTGPWLVCASCDEYWSLDDAEMDQYPYDLMPKWEGLICKLILKIGEEPAGVCPGCTGPCYYASGRIAKWTKVYATIEQAVAKSNPRWKAGVIESLYAAFEANPVVVMPVFWYEFKNRYGEFAVNGTKYRSIIAVFMMDSDRYWRWSDTMRRTHIWWMRRVGSTGCGRHSMNVYRSRIYTGTQSVEDWLAEHVDEHENWTDQKNNYYLSDDHVRTAISYLEKKAKP